MSSTRYKLLAFSVDEDMEVVLPADAIPLNSIYHPETLVLTVIALVPVGNETGGEGSEDTDSEDTDSEDK